MLVCHLNEHRIEKKRKIKQELKEFAILADKDNLMQSHTATGMCHKEHTNQMKQNKNETIQTPAAPNYKIKCETKMDCVKQLVNEGAHTAKKNIFFSICEFHVVLFFSIVSILHCCLAHPRRFWWIASGGEKFFFSPNCFWHFLAQKSSSLCFFLRLLTYSLEICVLRKINLYFRYNGQPNRKI